MCITFNAHLRIYGILNVILFFKPRRAPSHYHLAMQVFGTFTTASTLDELDDMVQSAAVVFGSPSRGEALQKPSVLAAEIKGSI